MAQKEVSISDEEEKKFLKDLLWFRARGAGENFPGVRGKLYRAKKGETFSGQLSKLRYENLEEGKR